MTGAMKKRKGRYAVIAILTLIVCIIVIFKITRPYIPQNNSVESIAVFNIGNIIVNNYILKTNSGYIVIDTGYPNNFKRFRAGLDEHGIPLEEIEFILLTHAHNDHAGFLNELLEATNAVLILDKLAVERLLAGHNQWIGGASGRLAEIFIRVMSFLGDSEKEFPPVILPSNAIIWDRETQILRKAGIPIDIISLPGHTADSIGFLTDYGKLFSGDATMNGFPSIRRNIIWIENLEDYKRSWDTMINSNAVRIFPSHGRPFDKSDLIRFRPYLDRIELRAMR